MRICVTDYNVLIDYYYELKCRNIIFIPCKSIENKYDKIAI